ncbi:hypothetical protein NKJ06_19690 [Mesorhizobium sp. M0293]|uniref:hypothetical protein n=1 Tax=unclassified Mesorhizobium TaxID=325217 RepID=UPI00333C0072
MSANDALSFLMAWTAAPFRIGSVTPSSSSLAALMTRDIGPDTGLCWNLVLEPARSPGRCWRGA